MKAVSQAASPDLTASSLLEAKPAKSTKADSSFHAGIPLMAPVFYQFTIPTKTYFPSSSFVLHLFLETPITTSPRHAV